MQHLLAGEGFLTSLQIKTTVALTNILQRNGDCNFHNCMLMNKIEKEIFLLNYEYQLLKTTNFNNNSNLGWFVSFFDFRSSIKLIL